jgi:serpin B
MAQRLVLAGNSSEARHKMVKTTDQSIDAAVVRGINELSLNIYDGLREQSGNLFFSPYSISSALGMAYAGARGATEQQMASVLRLLSDQTPVHASFAALNNILNGGSIARPYQLSVANAIWGAKGVRFRTDFLETIERAYGGRLSELDFAEHPEASRATINQWVQSETRHKIKDLLTAGSIQPDTLLLLTNAIYFKAAWLHPFDERWTESSQFLLAIPELSRRGGASFRGLFNRRQKVAVPFVRQTGRFGYIEERDLQVLEMRYAGEELGMVVILPRRVGGLAALEKSLNVEKLSTMLAGLNAQEVNVQLPKFKLTESLELSKLLSEMGMPLAFSDEADFSGMAERRDIFFSNVIHKAYLDVDESGTEAAAATGIAMVVSAARFRSKPFVFRADHPFLFLIRDRRTGIILFIGRVVNPL